METQINIKYSKFNSLNIFCPEIVPSGYPAKDMNLNLDGKYGEGTAEELQYLARTTLKISRVEYEEKISYYKSLVDKLKKEKGIE